MKKGSTLVEVMVALAVLAIVSASLVAGYLSINNVQLRQKEYLYFEGVCLDVDKLYDEYGVGADGMAWANVYFPAGTINAEGVQNGEGVVPNPDKWFVYYTQDFVPCMASDEQQIVYKVEFWYEKDGQRTNVFDSSCSLVVHIIHNGNSRVVVDTLNYGTPANNA